MRGHFGPINTVAFHPSGRRWGLGLGWALQQRESACIIDAADLQPHDPPVIPLLLLAPPAALIRLLVRNTECAPALPDRFFSCSFTTGGEDGYVRLHHMDLDYFTSE